MTKTILLICPRCNEPKDGICLPCKRKSGREYIARNKAKVRAKNNEWKEANKERCAAKRQEYLIANKVARQIQRAEYHVKNKEKLNGRSAAWQKANPEKCRIQMQNRRAKLREVGGKLSTNLFEVLFKLQRGKCACCGAKLTRAAHMDHIVPLARGGENEDCNIQLLTQKCNNQKHAKDPISFMQSKGFLI